MRRVHGDPLPDHEIWSVSDYRAGSDQGVADTIASFKEALTAAGITFVLQPYLERRDERLVMRFKVILTMSLPAKPNPPIIAH
jgi:hypothetical protein